MTSVFRRKTRTSKAYCEEKVCCPREYTEAELRCGQCLTSQCSSCDEYIHRDIKYEFHDRNLIDPPPFEKLCQASSLLNGVDCVDKNFADLRCENCKLCFCFDCYEALHKQGPRKSHKKISYRDYEQRQLKNALNDPIKPVSPIGDYDDTLTYVSCPQHQESEETDSMTSFTSLNSDLGQPGNIPDICMSTEKDLAAIEKELQDSCIEDTFEECQSFMLADEQEILKLEDEEDFIRKLSCDSNQLVKVVSIFGNTGDGKSHTLNHTFFGGKEVFKTSSFQASCTVGIWASFDPVNCAIIIDTEGLLGVTSNQNQRTRLLLKVLAISDVVIYRTRAERLHNDMFSFLSDASKAYSKHFAEELKAVAERSKMKLDITKLSPAVIVFHETVNTDVIGQSKGDRAPETVLRERFQDLDCVLEFSDLKYIGTRTQNPPTDFSRLRKAIQDQLQNNSIRAPRKPNIVFKTLKILNEKFSGEIEKPILATFPDQYFTCSSKCLSCSARCTRSMNHSMDEEPHESDKTQHCKYQHQYANKVYLCKRCFMQGKKHLVVPKTSASSDSSWVGLAKYVWAGDVLECPSCGVIFRSRQFWYGNPDVESLVQMEVRHVWPDGNLVLQGSHNAARKVLDGLSFVAETVSNVGSGPSKVVTDWMADQIAPAYWVPNAKIAHCHKCEVDLENEQKHHCRACGMGFCENCSSKKRPVPDRGWGDTPVRVCDSCYGNMEMTDSSDSTGGASTITARKVGEVISTAFEVVATAVDYPLGMLKDSARPAYWVSDEQITNCYICERPFTQKLPIHHCRACGQGVCSECSPSKRPVPLLGWDYPVRVCRKCEKKRDRI